ncbi:UNVERIFIED_CONTAM: hypothetical protein FKN15_056154 [Acipenser sinensis]
MFFMMPVSGYKDNGSTQLRLNGSSPCTGRVEVLYNGHWGRVCSHSWDLPDAEVVCKQLGCGAAVSAPHYKRPSGLPEDRVLNSVGCLGNETQLTECKSSPWGRKDCQHDWDAAVICAGTKKIQLVTVYNICIGRVELYYRGQWGAVCWNDFGINEAHVACRQAGCGEAETYSRFYSSIDDFPIWLDRVHCTGNETNLWDCPSDTWGHHKCDLRMQARVVCKGKDGPQLVGGGSRCSGRVEILHGGLLGAVCDEYLDLQDADVICRHLHCGAATSTPKGVNFGEGTGRAWKDSFHCRGNESRLRDCMVSWDQRVCDHGRDASIICTEEDWLLRLRGGESRCDGSVEVFLNSTWGRVSDTEWDLQDASVVCRHLNCGLAIEAHNPSKYAPGNSPVLLSQIECKGNESSLQGCHFSQSNESANSSVSVGVLCTEFKDLRLVSAEFDCAGRLEIFYNGTWGSVCSNKMSSTTVNMICQQLGCGGKGTLQYTNQFGAGSGPKWLDEVVCHGFESVLWQCSSLPWGQNTCQDSEVAGIECLAELPESKCEDVGSDTVEVEDVPQEKVAAYDDIEENDYVNETEDSAELPESRCEDVGSDTEKVEDVQQEKDAEYDDIEENDYHYYRRDLINNHKSVHGDAPSASGCMAGSWRNPGQAAARNQSTTFSATYTPQVRPYAPRPAVHWRKKYSLSNQKAGPPGNNLSIAGMSDCPTAAITAAQPRVLSTKGSSTKAVTRTPNLLQPSPFAAPIQHTGLREMGAKPGSAGVRTRLATPISRSNSSQIAGEQGTSKSAGLQRTLSSSSPAGGAGSSTGLVLDTSKLSSVESAALLSKTIGDCSVATGQGQIKGKSPVVVRTALLPQAAGGASFSGLVPSAAESFTPDRRLLLSKSAGSRSVESQGQSTDKLLPQASHPHSIKKPSILDKAVLNPKAAVGINNSGQAHRTCNLATAVPCNAQVESKTYFIDRTASIPKPAGGATGLCCSQAKPSALSSCSAKANPEGVLQADNKPQSLTALPSGVPLSASPVKNSKYTWVKKPVQGLAEPSKARAGTSSTSAESTAMPVSPHHRPESGLAGSIFKRRAAAGQKSHKGPSQSARPLKAAKTRYTWVSTTANSAKPARKPLSPKALEGTQKAPKSLELKKSVTPPGVKPSKKASASPKPSGTGSKYRWKAATAGQAAAAAKPVFKWKSEKENGERGSPGSGQPSSAEHSTTGASGGSSPSLSGYKLKSRMKIIRKNSGPGSVGESSPGSLTVKTRFSLRRRGQVPGKRLQARGLIPIGRHKLRRLPSADTHGSDRQELYI